MLQKVVAVFGYNNTRIYDLVKIRKLVKERLDAEVLLVKEAINDDDRKVVEHCFDCRVEDPQIVEPLLDYLRSREFELIACLPFSDKGVVGAAHVAKRLGLVGDDSSTSFAMLDKTLFRKLESSLVVDSSKYKKPFFTIAHSKEKVKEVFSTRGSFFIKPTSEGNSRGCMKIETQADLDRWFIENPTALKNGVICEEILANSNEFSFDGVDGCYWITQKFTTSGAYRAEYQHIIPAPFPADVKGSLHSTLKPLINELGSNGGAFHHEFFVLDDGRVASVEPNRRPAGMWLWDLAGWAFEEFDPWSRWIDWSAGRSVKKGELRQKAYSGIRGVIVKHDGKINRIDARAAEDELKTMFGEQNVRLSFLKNAGDTVRREARDNSDFVAFVALKHESHSTLLSSLEAAEEIVLRHVEIAQ